MVFHENAAICESALSIVGSLDSLDSVLGRLNSEDVLGAYVSFFLVSNI